jgi:hypothetical protein
MMRSLRTASVVLSFLAVGLTTPCLVWGAGTHSLQSKRKAGDVDQVAAQLEVGGELKMVGEEGVKTLKMSAQGVANYHEKLLAPAAEGWDALRLLRQYEDAKATIKVDAAATKPALRKERGMIAVVGQGKEALLMFGVDGPLTRDELSLIELPCNTAILDELLPAKSVQVNDHWDHTPELAAALLGLDAAGASDLQSTLTKVEGNTATIGLAGTVEGAIDGVSTKIEVKANYRYDLKAGRVVFMGMLLKEARSIGHVGPGMDVTAKFQVKLTPNAKHEALAAYQDAGALKELMPEYSMLEYEPARKSYRMVYDSRWHVMSDDPDTVSFRMVDRGDLVAQAKLSTPAGVSHNRFATMEAFQEEVQETLGEDFGEITSATTSENSLGVVTHRVTVQGVVSELPIEWRYYLLIGPNRQQLIAAFTLEQSVAERFGDADARMVESVEFVEERAEGESARVPRLQLK